MADLPPLTPEEREADERAAQRVRETRAQRAAQRANIMPALRTPQPRPIPVAELKGGKPAQKDSAKLSAAVAKVAGTTKKAAAAATRGAAATHFHAATARPAGGVAAGGKAATHGGAPAPIPRAPTKPKGPPAAANKIGKGIAAALAPKQQPKSSLDKLADLALKNAQQTSVRTSSRFTLPTFATEHAQEIVILSLIIIFTIEIHAGQKFSQLWGLAFNPQAKSAPTPVTNVAQTTQQATQALASNARQMVGGFGASEHYAAWQIPDGFEWYSGYAGTGAMP